MGIYSTTAIVNILLLYCTYGLWGSHMYIMGHNVVIIFVNL